MQQESGSQRKGNEGNQSEECWEVKETKRSMVPMVWISPLRRQSRRSAPSLRPAQTQMRSGLKNTKSIFKKKKEEKEKRVGEMAQ